MALCNYNSAAEALSPILKRLGEQDEDRPRVLFAMLQTWGEAEFFAAIPKPLHARMKYYLEKAGWERPPSIAPVKTDFDKAIDFFRKGAWTRLTKEQRMAVLEAYA